MFASCIPIKGAVRSGICDVDRGHFETVPNSLIHVINRLRPLPYAEVIATYSEEDRFTIDEYLDWLVENEWAFWCNDQDADNFIDLPLNHEIPLEIDNAIIDIDAPESLDYHKVFDQLLELGVRHVQIRSYVPVLFSFYVPLVKLCSWSRLNSISILTPYVQGEEIGTDDLIVDGKRLIRISSIIIFNAPYAKVIVGDDETTSIIYVKENITGKECCGQISPSFFSINMDTYLESQHFNTCLNKKISIDTQGNIKNCPSMPKSFGNIRDTTLREALTQEGFKDIWHIRKDDIAVCQDCEFRHICTDCRAYVDDSSDSFSRPLKCGYNPYQAKWKGEEGYVPVIEMSIRERERIKKENLFQ